MGILSVVAQTAAIDCILRQDSPVMLQGQDLPLATVVQWANGFGYQNGIRTLLPFLRAHYPPKKVAADDAINWTRDVLSLGVLFVLSAFLHIFRLFIHFG